MLHGSINHVSEGPGEYPFGVGGYYAVYFAGHMPAAEARARQLGQL